MIYDCLEWDKNNIPVLEPEKAKNDTEKVNNTKSENVAHEKSDL